MVVDVMYVAIIEPTCAWVTMIFQFQKAIQFQLPFYVFLKTFSF